MLVYWLLGFLCGFVSAMGLTIALGLHGQRIIKQRQAQAEKEGREFAGHIADVIQQLRATRDSICNDPMAELFRQNEIEFLERLWREDDK